MRVLIGYDGSAGAAQAVALAGAIDWPSGTAIRVASAVEADVIQIMPWPAVGAVPALSDDARLGPVREALADLVGRLSKPGRSVDSILLRDRPASALVDEARSFAADLVVTGSRGHGPIESLLLGSVSAEVVDHAPCPVLVARRPTLRRILFATDGSDTARRAGTVLSDWPIFAGIPVCVVSVADVLRPWTTGIAPTMYQRVLQAYAKDVAEAEATHAAIATEATRSLRLAGRDAEAEVRRGDAASEIIATASACKADLIVLGSRGETGLKRLVLGSVARNVLQSSDACVLIVHAPRRETPPREPC